MKTTIRKNAKPAMAIHNNTEYSLEVIGTLTVIGTTVNNWMQRNIVLYNHPDDKGRVISVGTTFDNSMQVIADDESSVWSTAIDYAVRGKVYVRD